MKALILREYALVGHEQIAYIFLVPDRFDPRNDRQKQPFRRWLKRLDERFESVTHEMYDSYVPKDPARSSFNGR